MAGGAGFERCLCTRFTICVEVRVSPAGGRGVLDGIFNHELDVRGCSGNERLRIAKDFVIFGGRGVFVMQGGDNGAVGIRELAVAEGLERHIIRQNGADAVEVAFFVGYGDELPVSISGRNFDSVNWGSLAAALS